eukprot:276736_1
MSQSMVAKSRKQKCEDIKIILSSQTDKSFKLLMDLDLLWCWIARILITIVLCCAVYIFRSNELNKVKVVKPNIHNKIVQYWSSICYVGCIISSCLLLTTTIIPICMYSYGFAICFILLTKVSLTFYQVARLQYCFSLECHSYGYPQSVFVIFYFVGFICVMLICISCYLRLYFINKSVVHI